MPGSFTSDGLRREMTDSIEKKEILLSALVMLKEFWAILSLGEHSRQQSPWA
jgi:hypothetical protein